MNGSKIQCSVMSIYSSEKHAETGFHDASSCILSRSTHPVVGKH